jgi:hypothetical protein
MWLRIIIRDFCATVALNEDTSVDGMIILKRILNNRDRE